MDIYCPICAEPWDLDCLHEAVEENYGPDAGYTWKTTGRGFEAEKVYDQSLYDPLLAKVRADFRKRGCVALGGDDCRPAGDRPGPILAAYAAAAMDLMPDDFDGVAAVLNEF